MERTLTSLSRRAYTVVVDISILAALSQPAILAWTWVLLGHLPTVPDEAELLGC